MVKRVVSEKKKGFDVEAKGVLKNIKEDLKINGIESLRIINIYDIANVEEEDLEKSLGVIFSEPNVDNAHIGDLELKDDETAFGIEYLPGQYDQRADSTEQTILILTGVSAKVRCKKAYILTGKVKEKDLERIKAYLINPTDSREVNLTMPESLDQEKINVKDVEYIDIDFKDEEAEKFIEDHSLAMSVEDLLMIRDYYQRDEKRNPTETELKLIDTYWSDHCRHTTFETIISEVDIEDGAETIKAVFDEYENMRQFVYDGKKPKQRCLMDLATIKTKEMRKRGVLDDLEVSEEINACSVEIEVDRDGKKEPWLLMFKNETHNHPTEIEPFGGAATCLGGAIRDPLSGRAFVHQAMRVTGSGDPNTPVEETLEGKLPQIKITRTAANGYSSYGNQIGVATGQVREFYHEGFVAKRMELGAVIGAVPLDHVRREEPVAGDVIILLGGRTGKDGIGGATGSSKSHDESSIETSGAEVQKGNAPTERKILRLFRKEEVLAFIKKCNDFGAGGVSVAVGELADGLDINLDKVLTKRDDMNGTDLALSESQERMAVVVDEKDVEEFIRLADVENLEATVIAKVTDKNRLVMTWRGKKIVDISRDFLKTNGYRRTQDIEISNFDKFKEEKIGDVKEKWFELMSSLNNASQKGLQEKFDSSVGAGTVLLPLGGIYQLTREEGMVAKIPVESGDTDTVSVMSFGYNPDLSKASPFHGGLYAVVESASKLAALGADPSKIRLSLQEYFGKLGEDKARWGLPFTSLLGALKAQIELDIPAIGGKDSMSGTFNDLDVPPTLVSFAVATSKASKVVSSALLEVGSGLYIIRTPIDDKGIVDFAKLRENLKAVSKLVNDGRAISISSIKAGGICEAISNMSFGNKVGVELYLEKEDLFKPQYGSFIIESEIELDGVVSKYGEGVEIERIGKTIEEKEIRVGDVVIPLDELIETYEKPLEKVFPTVFDYEKSSIETVSYNGGPILKGSSFGKPNVLITAFPGTNSEYDSKRAFERAGAKADILVFKNRNFKDVEESINEFAERISKSQIVMIPGGFSAGDEPEGSGKFIATVFRNPKVKDEIMKMLYERDGLMIGICNGFQALIKLGLLPYGRIKEIEENSPTLTYNSIGRHSAKMVRTRVSSVKSPWMSKMKVGDVYTLPISHGEGRFFADEEALKELKSNGQIISQYVDLKDNATMNPEYNPNGSVLAIEGITDPTGRILGKMGHSERFTEGNFQNIRGEKYQPIFEGGVEYFK